MRVTTIPGRRHYVGHASSDINARVTSFVVFAVGGCRLGRQVRQVLPHQDRPQHPRPAFAALHGPGRATRGGRNRHGGSQSADGGPRRPVLRALRHDTGGRETTHRGKIHSGWVGGWMSRWSVGG